MISFSILTESVNNPSMKEVKGLGDRLFGLEQLLVGAKKYLQEQAEMAQVGLFLLTLPLGKRDLEMSNMWIYCCVCLYYRYRLKG